MGVAPTALEDTEHMLRSVANRVGAALIVVGLLIASALIARVDHVVSLVGFCLGRDRPLNDLADHANARRALAGITNCAAKRRGERSSSSPLTAAVLCGRRCCF